ncbi:MAG TPA: DUF5131 family protein [Thermoanaerobaculia bacterium]|jgi:protein gp37|nr:DUF5131 family protein [Thermoanaerobaculia bacterium]
MSIEWTDQVLNPVRAHRDMGDGSTIVGHHCEKVSPGCLHCYAETINLGGRFGPDRGTRLPFMRSSRDRVEIRLEPKVLDTLRKVRKPRRFFVGSMTDLFADFVPEEMLLEVLEACHAAALRGAVVQLLTKRPERMVRTLQQNRALAHPNLWTGVSVESSRELYRIDLLFYVAGTTRFVSYEPALTAIDFGLRLDRVAWLIVGGESGPGARPFHLEWGLDACRQAIAAGCPPFVKQVGSNPWFRGKPLPCNAARGGDMGEWPEKLRLRGFPQINTYLAEESAS